MFGSDRAAASEMCTDYQMIEAVFKFAHDRNIRNVNFGGMRYDPTNKEEQSVWRSVNRHAHNAEPRTAWCNGLRPTRHIWAQAARGGVRLQLEVAQNCGPPSARQCNLQHAH